MIKYVQGDILLSEAQAIAHCVAPHDHFNQGLALALRDSYPAMAKDFRHYCKQVNPKAGETWLWACADKVVFNLMAQEPAESSNANPGKATIKSLKNALKALVKQLKKENIFSLAIPRIATGVGGLDWGDVQPLLEEYLGSIDTEVVVYEKYVAKEKAVENLQKAA